MDFATIIGAVVSSGVVSLATARWIAQRFVDHRLAKDLREFQQSLDGNLAVAKSRLDTELTSFKAHVEATLRREVEEYLGDRAADRQYQLEARKRLYGAIGPLRFQLIAATRDFANRIDRFGRGKQPYKLTLNGYFGRSTVFRLVRLLGIVELIERQMAYADFAVDPSTIALLRFKHKAFLCLSSSALVLNHPKANWDEQREHVYFDTLSMIAAAVIVSETNGQQRVMRFDEFNALVDDATRIESIQPIPRLMEGFNASTKPILWLRLVALAGLSALFVQREGPQAGVTPERFDLKALVQASRDDFISANHERYFSAIRDLVGEEQFINVSEVPASMPLQPTGGA